MATTAAVASATSTMKTSTGVKAAAAHMRDAATTMIELRMMTAIAGMSLPGMVLVEVRMIAPAISPTPSQTI
jgi:hypothetical protein